MTKAKKFVFNNRLMIALIFLIFFYNNGLNDLFLIKNLTLQ